MLLLDHDWRVRLGLLFDLRPDVLHLVFRRLALIVGILAAGDHSDRGDSENDAELVHVVFCPSFFTSDAKTSPRSPKL